jgi:hypothetical protein
MSPMGPSEQSPPRATGRGLRLSTVWVVVAFVVPATFVLVRRLGSLDLAYAVRAGQIMLERGELLRDDVFLFTTRCEPWANQQWGAEILLAGTFDALGWLGLALLRAGCTLGVVALLYGACRSYGAARRQSAWLTLLAAVLVMSGFQLRAQLVGVLLFAAMLWILARRDEHPNGVYLAVPLLLVWANTHGSFPFGILLLVVALVEDRVASRPTGRLLAATLLALAATAITPFGPSVWVYVVELSTNPQIREVVEEWQPPWVPSYSGVVFFASVALAAVVGWRNRRSLPWPAWVQLGLFLAPALMSTRAVYWWGMVLPVTLARLPWARREDRADPRNRVNAVLVAVVAAIPVFAVFRWLPYTGYEPPPRLVSYAPPGITSELRSILEPGEPFKNPQAWGSWFELTLPGHLLFVDSRFELMPSASLRTNGRIAGAQPGWEEALDALPVRVLVVNRDREPALVEALEGHPTWRQVYADDDGLIFVRDDREPVVLGASCEDVA